MSGKNLSTELIHAGDNRPCKNPRGALSVPETFPVYMTSAFAFESLRALDAVYAGDDGYIYSRMANPNADEVSSVLAAAEEGDGALVFSSGMAAITTAILSLVSAGDHIIASPVCYMAECGIFSRTNSPVSA
jgi:methionine-gamma-lyase